MPTLNHPQRVYRRHPKPSRQGAVLVVMVLLVPILLMMCAFAINIAYMELNRTEIMIATDAAARAGGRELAITRSQANARSAAKQFAALNEVAGQALTLQDSDLAFGHSSRNSAGRYTFSTTGSVNAVQVTADRSAGSADGSISLLMPSVFGISSFETQQQAISTAMEVDIALVLDRSGSMAFAVNEVASPFVPPASAPEGWQFCDPAPPICRWRNVVNSVAVFLNEVAISPADERVSISTYAETAITNQDLTTDAQALMNSLAPYTNSFCAGGTNIGGGILEGSASLRLSPGARSGAMKVIVVLTDGIHNIGTSPSSAASTAASDGVQIFTVTYSDEANQSTMQSVASKGGGIHFHATSASDLINAFQTIARSLPTLLTK